MQMKDGGLRNESETGVPRILLAAIFLAFAMMAIRIITVNSPVMGSDEYAYFHSAKYQSAGSYLYSLDPYLQQVDNKVYPWLYRLWAVVADQHVDSVGRLFNALGFCAGSLFLYGIFVRVFDRRVATVSSVLYLLMPFSFYATTLLPEVEFQLFVYLLVFVWVNSETPYSAKNIALASMISAVGYLIKPHAIAVILASGSYLTWINLRAGHGSFLKRLSLGVAQSVVYAVATLVLIKLLRHALDPGGGDALVASFYQGYLQRLLNPEYLLSNIGSIGSYVGGHLWVWLVFFAPGVVCLMAEFRHWLPAKLSFVQGAAQECQEGNGARRGRLALFLVLLGASMLCMVAAFTDAAAAGSEFERGRLHGRYVAAMLPFLLAFSVWSASAHKRRGVALLGGLALVSIVLWGRFWFRIYPWDYPDLFGLFSPRIRYWSFDGVLSWPVLLTCSLGVACWAAYALTSRRLLAYVAFFFGAMLAANLQMSAWLRAQNELTREVLADGEAIKSYMGRVQSGSGLVVTYDRFGQASYLLATMDSVQRVLQLDAGRTLEERDVPADVHWVVAPVSMKVKLTKASVLNFGTQRLYLLDSTYQWPVLPTKPDWHGNPLSFDTSRRGFPNLMHGFHNAEEWGSWTAEHDAYLELPAMVSGRVVVDFFGWVADPAANSTIQVRCGNASVAVTMTGTGAEHRVELVSTVPSDRLYFEAKPVMDGGTPLGVAVARIRITASERAGGG